MSGEKTEVEIEMSRVFKKTLEKLSSQMRDVVDDQIELIIDNPELGEQKKGDLSYLRVHKFKVDSNQFLLSYSFKENGSFIIYLLNIGSHENFYQEAKLRRKADLKLIDG